MGWERMGSVVGKDPLKKDPYDDRCEQRDCIHVSSKMKKARHGGGLEVLHLAYNEMVGIFAGFERAYRVRSACSNGLWQSDD